jgi:rhomboid family GlyGly-CTERM serine protease
MTARKLYIALEAWLLPAVTVALVLAAALGGDAARTLGRYERSGVLDGELWRLLSAHAVHLGWSHAWLNVAGLVLVWALFGRALRGWRGVLALACAVAAIDAGFILNEPRLEWYVGFSGALHGLFAAGIVAGLGAREREAVVLGALLAAKLAWEQLAGAVPFTEALAGGPVVESAHLYGALGGALAGVALAAAASRPAIIRTDAHKGTPQ